MGRTRRRHIEGIRMGLFTRFVNNTRKPEGILGSLMVGGMNSGHAALADWGMDKFPPMTPADIIDLGCGGGRNAATLMRRYPHARMCALDYAPLSVRKTTSYNRAQVDEGRCRVLQGDVSRLDLPDDSFNLATAFETIYFWPGLEECFANVHRILRPGGHFCIVNESDGTDAESLKFQQIIDGMRCYTTEQIDNALRDAGFTTVTCHHHESKPWIVVVAQA